MLIRLVISLSLIIGFWMVTMCVDVAGFSKQTSRYGAPISGECQPEIALIKATITISGSSVNVGKNKTVTIAIKKGGVLRTKLTATLDSRNQFRIAYKGTEEIGLYTVEIKAPDGRQTASTSFQIIPPSRFAPQVRSALQKPLTLITTASGSINEMIENTPDAPAKTELVRINNSIQEQSSELQSLVSDFQQVATNLGSLAELDSTVADDMQEAMTDWLNAVNDAAEESDAARRRIDGMNTSLSLCDRVDLCRESYTAIKQAVTLVAGPAKVLKSSVETIIGSVGGSLLDGRLDGERANKLKEETAKLAFRSITKVESVVEFVARYVPSGVNELLGTLYSSQCEGYEGPFTASMDVTVQDSGKFFYSYGLTLKGQLIVRYAKPAQVRTQVTGRFQGCVVEYRFKENVFAAEPMPKASLVLARFAIKPIPGIDLSNKPFDPGLFIRTALPSYFFLPLTGELEGNKLRFKLNTTGGIDLIKPSIRQVIIAVPPAAPVPVVKQFVFPLQNCKYVISRAIKGLAEVDVVPVGEKMEFKKTMTRDESLQNNDVKIHFTISIQGVNPPAKRWIVSHENDCCSE